MAKKGPSIVVVDYGMGNIHSIVKALALYSQNIIFSNDPDVIRHGDALVLPGDGAFSAAMSGLGIDKKQALLDSVQRGVSLLGICIGFQMLFEDSNENGVHKGLGLLGGNIRKFVFDDESVRIPHMGWNNLKFQSDSIYQSKEKKPHVYFIHSYRAKNVPEDIVVANCNYNEDEFVALVQKDNITAMQFHPEKSDSIGLNMLQKWVETL